MFSDNPDSLIYVHIGKCGGATLGKSLLNSPIVNERFRTFTKIHVCKPPILKNASYAIVVRNPIKRAVSAFNWRYKL
ncbi:sulfotransferase family protein, partial [Candidatus Thioglobus sp.]|nr:sulfotransferase family protein [Candidatus Thioglobus sp.]